MSWVWPISLAGLVGMALTARTIAQGSRVRPFGILLAWTMVRCWCIFRYGVRRMGRCTVPCSGPVIVTANHRSTADPLMLSVMCPQRVLGFLIAQEYARLPVARLFIEAVRCIPVRRDGRDAEGTRTAIKRLRDGEALGIFIEGRIPKPGQVEPPKDGIAMLALRTGATVIPAYISGQIYHDGIAASLFARHRGRVRYGPPVDLQAYTSRDRQSIKQATLAINDAIMALRTAP